MRGGSAWCTREVSWPYSARSVPISHWSAAGPGLEAWRNETTVSADVAGPAAVASALRDDVELRESTFDSVWGLLMCQAAALVIQVLAVCLARQDSIGPAVLVSCSGFALTFASALWALTRPRLQRAVRNTATVCLGVTTTLQWRMTDPLLFSGFDEQLHIRTLHDIDTSHGLFQAHPLLGVSPHYPGLESFTALLQQLGLPMMGAATATILIARLMLVLTLCDAVEQMTGSPRAGGLAVAAYAISAQFVFFNSQYAYQTLALPLALAAVALIARARVAVDPRALLGGATICLLAVAVTHHVTSFLTASFLVVWAIMERGSQARWRILAGAFVAVGSTTVWAMIQWALLREYFRPIIDDVASQFGHGGGRRAPFSDPNGYATPLWERLFLVYYAAVVTLLALIFVLAGLRRLRPARGARWSWAFWAPPTLLVCMVSVIPLLFAARILPSGGEMGDRATSFLFFPFSVLVADGVVRRFWSRQRSPGLFARSVALALATGAFVGGYLLGSGPDWARLPGSYLVSADNRSMDSETLAAVRWARDGLAAGSRIGADRVSSDLLASQARLWPVLHERGLDVPSLYLADQWGQPQTDLVRRLNLRYLYVDRRLADELPHVGSYFYRGETAAPQKLTVTELEKFDKVPGIRVVYRHGPISIYDLGALGVAELRSGWFGKTADDLSFPVQLAIGLLAGLMLVQAGRSRSGRTVIRVAKSFRMAAGPSLTFAAAVGASCVISVTMLLAHIWLGPPTFLSAALVILLVNPQWAVRRLREGVERLRWGWIVATVLVTSLVAAAVALSVTSAWAPDITKVGDILDDPSAVHLSAQSQRLPHALPALDNPPGTAEGGDSYQ